VHCAGGGGGKGDTDQTRNS